MSTTPSSLLETQCANLSLHYRLSYYLASFPNFWLFVQPLPQQFSAQIPQTSGFGPVCLLVLLQPLSPFLLFTDLISRNPDPAVNCNKEE